MTKEMLRKEIEKQAKELNITIIEMITAMQGIVAQNGDSKVLETLIELKRDYINI